MKIVCFKYGEALYPEARLFADRHGNHKIPLSFCFYLIERENRKILVDTGCEGERCFGMYVFQKPLSLLKEYGLVPEDITDVIITHAHYDHIDGVSNYRHANIYIQELEYQEKKELLDEFNNCIIFKDRVEVCNGILVERIGGHTEGSCVVFAGEYLLCGDDAYYLRNLQDKVRIGICYNKEIAQAFVEKYSESTYKPLFFHDSSIMPYAVGFEIINETRIF